MYAKSSSLETDGFSYQASHPWTSLGSGSPSCASPTACWTCQDSSPALRKGFLLQTWNCLHVTSWNSLPKQFRSQILFVYAPAWGAHRNGWVWDVETAVLANTTCVEGLTKHTLLSLLWASLGFPLYRSIKGREPQGLCLLITAPVDKNISRQLFWHGAWHGNFHLEQRGQDGDGFWKVRLTQVLNLGSVGCFFRGGFFFSFSFLFFPSRFRLSLPVLPGSFLL